MRLHLKRLLMCSTVMLAASAAFAEVPANSTPANEQASVTAPAIAWPVVGTVTRSLLVHMTPGSTETIVTTVPAAGETLAATPPPPPAAPTLVVNVNLSTQRMTVIENGAEKYTWPISSARAGYRTPTGTFKPTWMSKMWYSRQYDMAPMPHAVFFSGGVAIHATQATGMLGVPASHGCVRLAPRNAATFYSLVNRHGKDLTRIAVTGTPRNNAPAMASNRRNGQPRYAYIQGGFFQPVSYQGYGYGAAPAQYAGPSTGKKQKLSQRGQVARTNTSGFGYGFGGL